MNDTTRRGLGNRARDPHPGTSPGAFGAFLFALVSITAAAPPLAGSAQEEPSASRDRQHTDLRRYVPDTVSEGWRAVYDALPDPTRVPPLPGPEDLEGWKKVFDALEQDALQRGKGVVEQLHVTVASMELGGVGVLEITPEGWVDNGKRLLYTHGGAYTFFSARSTLPSSALAARYTGLRVISIDYTNAPIARWQEVKGQVISVFRALHEAGFAMDDLAIYGDSAGGGLAAGAVLELRDSGLGMPAAVVLWSPWADITETGDTYRTLRDAEPTYLYETALGPSADAYADREDQKHPFVSPVYGDFAKGFPPTLIQGGTREIFLSNFVRLYQALDTAGQTVKLDLYEGMPHVFQIKLPGSPESITAMKKMVGFLVEHLEE